MEVTEKKGVKWRRRAARTLAVVVLALVAYLVITPTGRYLLRAGWEEGKILARRRPISAIIVDSANPSFDYLRMFEALRHQSSADIKFFSTVEDAHRWLGLE